MKIRTILLALLLSWGMPLAAKAETDYSQAQRSCDAQCDRLSVSQDNISVPIADVYDPERRHTSQSSRGNQSLTKRIYLGFAEKLPKVETKKVPGGLSEEKSQVQGTEKS